MKNLTKCYTQEEIKENIFKYAKEFSEGNIHLEELLLFCFQNNIMTKACCSGHKKEEGNDYDIGSYILFVISKDKVDLISNAMNIILKSNLGDKCEFNIIPKFSEDNIFYEVVFRLKREHLNYRDIFFQIILNMLKQSNIHDVTNFYSNLFTMFEIFHEQNIDLSEANSQLGITKDKPITFEISKIIYVEELGFNTLATLEETDGAKFIEYIESLKNIKDFNLDDLNNSFNLTEFDIKKISKLLNHLDKRNIKK